MHIENTNKGPLTPLHVILEEREERVETLKAYHTVKHPIDYTEVEQYYEYFLVALDNDIRGAILPTGLTQKPRTGIILTHQLRAIQPEDYPAVIKYIFQRGYEVV